jgi:maltose O-acetyltransferase
VTAPYDPSAPELLAARTRAKAVLREFAASGDVGVLRALFGELPEDAVIEPPFYCDYGSNIHFGSRFYANSGCVFLDCAPITIGDNVQLGPLVQLLAPSHPLDAETRRTGVESAEPIAIGDDAWLGGGVIVLPGVTIGPRSVIGAGSVVTKDVPADVVAVGNPCRVLRLL